MLALILLFMFLGTAVVAMLKATACVRRVAMGVGVLLDFTLIVVLALDMVSAQWQFRWAARAHGRPYSRNLANTVMTVILTVMVMTAMYSQIWYDGLRAVVTHLETDTISAPSFPAIAVFQRWQNSQAEIYPNEFKCYSGPKDDNAVQCSSLSVEESLNTSSCDCGDSWPSAERVARGGDTVMWLGRNATYYSMLPSESTVSRGAGHFLTLQVFFSYNKTESFNNESVTLAPGMWVAIYDPTFDLAEALSSGEVYTAQIDANSHTVVDIGLVYYHLEVNFHLGRYSLDVCLLDVTISVRQNLDLVCDVDYEFWYLCHLTLEVQIPSFRRTVVREEFRYQWSNVVADAGAYFALVQFLSWIVSGSAWG
ncbi:hypothetical protein K491DRAFT_742118 [Lophiostoma macrostomum CBS 122681]|uniref:Uncharacterized protein n=1 Tax=Lophiostoma macrostomum CBS 122681 TaxID=1314788 RepID=A0A6A6TBW8_9PLEO|nr:hypothetical protein K491DRAFT_742118 [Lophiostoma macrostomum CBS 122681]